MDPDLENVIRQALTDAKAAGKDHLGQTELAVRAVQRVWLPSTWCGGLETWWHPP